MMINVYHVMLVIWLECKNIYALNKTEEKIANGIMKELAIDHRILVEEADSDLVNLGSFKNSESWTMTVWYRDLEELFNFFVKGSFPDPYAMIVLKVPNLSRIVEFLNDVTSSEESYKMRRFTWLVIVDWSESKLEDEEKLLVPYNCEFFILHPVSPTKFKLVEVYKVKNETVTYDYGIWDENFGLIATEVSWYRRRKDLNNITMVMMGMKFHGEVGTCCTDRQCAHIEFIRCLALMMNFKIKWIKKATSTEFYLSSKETDLTDLHGTLSLLDFYRSTGEMVKFDLTNPVYTNYINWFIKDPGTKKRGDFYFKPFETDIWISILLTIFIGGVTSLTLHFLSRKFANGRDAFPSCDDVFMPLECLCNQDGSKTKGESSLRLLKFSIRFLTLFIIGSYFGSITSFLTIRIPRIPFDDLKGFLENGEYIIGADSMEIHKFFKYSQDPLIHQIKEENKFLRVPNETVYTVDFITGANKTVCSEKLIYAEYNDEAYSYGIPCKVYRIEQPIAALGMSALIPRNSPFKEMINLNIIRFQMSGLRHRAQKYILKHRVFKEELPGFDTVEFGQIVQLLKILSFGITTSIVIFVSELIFKLMVKRGSEKRKALFRGYCNVEDVKRLFKHRRKDWNVRVERIPGTYINKDQKHRGTIRHIERRIR